MRDPRLDESFDRVMHDMLRAVAAGFNVMRMPDGSLSMSSDPRSCFNVLRRDGDRDAVVRSMIISACDRAENVSMGSTRTIVRVLGNVGRALKRGQTQGSIANAGRTLIDQLPHISTRPSRDAIVRVLRGSVPAVADMIIEAVDLAGSECKIFVEPSTTGFNSVERVVGHTFKVLPDAMVMRDGRWHASDVKCLIIDGIIDRVSEIDSILQKCHESKRPMVILARGFSDETLMTLRVNHARKTLNVVPVSVEFDLETVNVLLDIAAVVGCDVVSSLKGEVISTIKFDEIPTVRSIAFVGPSMTMVTDSHASVDVHLRNLIEKRNAEALPAVKRILDARIRSLSASSVIIRIPDDGTQGGRMMVEIDSGLKLVRSILQHGSVSRGRLATLDDALGLLEGVIDDEVIPTLTLGAGLYYATSIADSLGSAAICVLSE